MTVPLFEGHNVGVGGGVVLHRFRASSEGPEAGAVSSRHEPSYLSDLKSALDAATNVNDFLAARRLLFLHCDYLAHLAAMGPADLIGYLEGRGVWREVGDWPVYKTAGQPCLAFTAQVSADGLAVDLIALGACYRYPVASDEAWWSETIMPRVQAL